MESGYAQAQPQSAGSFDIVRFMTDIKNILRALEVLFAIIVFGVISDNGRIEAFGNTYCIFNGKDAPCNLGVATGVIAFLLAGAILAIHLVDKVSSALANQRRNIAIFEAGATAFWTFMWFVTFCVLASEWKNASGSNKYVQAGQSALAFSFFSIGAWGASTFFAIRAVRDPSNNFSPYGNVAGAADPSMDYAEFPAEGSHAPF